MPAFFPLFRHGPALGFLFSFVPLVASATTARLPVDLAGTWDLTLERTGTDKSATCRIMLRPQMSFRGDYFMGFPPACRHAMPVIAMATRWKMAGEDQLVFDDASGATVLSFTASGSGFEASQTNDTYHLNFVGKPDSPLAFDVGNEQPARGLPIVQQVSQRDKAPVAERERPSDLAGRYAVMRDKRDTGCMITLDDSSRVKGGERAQLAPGCRDQGIVIFDPSAWMLVKGELVLTARAGHKTVLEKQGEGLWAKDAKEGGKPLGLKKL